jgi:predicted patatin/cPLA2 family phospholipase
MARHSRLSFAALLILVCGCGSTPSRFAGLDKAQARTLAQQMAADREKELTADLRSAFAARPPRNILVLSGGGANGAFGCGVLDGWRDTPGGRPQFDVVTGVSTGALMATFAFLGEPCDDRTLHEVYTKTRDPDIHDGPFTWGAPDSIFDTGPLERLIAKHVTTEAIARVAAAHRSGRRLYVATVDLDAGDLVIWPLSKIAAEGGPEAAERFRKILLATAAIPVVFPPVRIDGDLHVDAGLRETVFLRRAMLGVSKAYGATRPHDAGTPAPAVWAIVNGRLQIDPTPVDDNLVDIGRRSLGIYTQSLEFLSVREIAHIAASNHPAFEFRYASIPAALEEESPETNPLKPMFEPKRMSLLYAAGREMAQGQKAWHEGPPPVDEDPANLEMARLPGADAGIGR